MSEFRFWGFFLVLPCSLPSSVHHSWHIWNDYAWPIERWNVRMSRLFCPNLKEIGFVTDWLQVTELCAGICLALLPQFSAAISNCCQFYRILKFRFRFRRLHFWFSCWTRFCIFHWWPRSSREHWLLSEARCGYFVGVQTTSSQNLQNVCREIPMNLYRSLLTVKHFSHWEVTDLL